MLACSGVENTITPFFITPTSCILLTKGRFALQFFLPWFCSSSRLLLFNNLWRSFTFHKASSQEFCSSRDIYTYVNLNSREKFEPGPEFEPRTSRSLSWRSTTWAILKRDLDLYRQLNQDSSSGRTPSQRFGGPRFKSRPRFKLFSWI